MTELLENELSQELKEFALDLCKVDGFSVDKIAEILPPLMTKIDKYKKMKGDDKKELILKVLRYIVDKTDGPGNDEIWDPIIKSLLPGILNLLIEVNNGKLTIKKKCKYLRCIR